MIVDRFERQLKQAQNSSFGFVEDLRDSYNKAKDTAERAFYGNLDSDSVAAQFEDFRSNIRMFRDEPPRVKTDDKIELFNLASKIDAETLINSVRRVETKPVESMPDMPESKNTSMIPDLDLRSGGLVLAAGVLGLALLRGDS